MCDNCSRKYGFKESSCDAAMHRAAEKYLRLRSDEWLEKAAQEIVSHIDYDGNVFVEGQTYGQTITSEEATIAILRKHRDGAA